MENSMPDLPWSPDPRSRDEDGSAMVMTLMVIAIVTALATTIGVVTVNNLQASWRAQQAGSAVNARSEEHTSELQSLMRNSYAVFCLKKNKISHLQRAKHGS